MRDTADNIGSFYPQSSLVKKGNLEISKKKRPKPRERAWKNARDHRSRATRFPSPFFSLLFSLSLSLFPKTRETQSQRRRPFVCGLLSAFSFFFSKIRESSLTLSRAVARVFK